MDSPEIKLCNCAECRRELLGDSLRVWYFGLAEDRRKRYPSPVAGRLLGRPYCEECISTRPRPKTGVAQPVREESPWSENGVRELEDGDQGAA